MQPFTYARPASLNEAFHLAQHPGAALLAGGTTMVDLMRGDLSAPSSIVDIGHLAELAAGSVKNLGHYAASGIAWWPKRPSSTAALT